MSGGGWVWGDPYLMASGRRFAPFRGGISRSVFSASGGGPFMRDICEALDLVWRMGISMRSLLYFAHTEETSGFLNENTAVIITSDARTCHLKLFFIWNRLYFLRTRDHRDDVRLN